MIKNINELAKFVKGGADVLQKAITSEDEISIEFVDGSFVSDSELEDLKNERFNSGKKEGQTICYDFAMKDVKKDFGLDIEGKNREDIIKAARSKVMSDAKIEPDKKISELNQSLENLRKQYETDKSSWEGEVSSYKGKLKDISIMNELQRNTPDIKGLKSSQFATLARTEFEFDFSEDGMLVAKKNGNIIKDKMEKPIPVKDILTDYATQNGWNSVPGRGGNNEFGDKSEFKTLNDVYKHMEQNNINPMSAEGEKLINDFKNAKKE